LLKKVPKRFAAAEKSSSSETAEVRPTLYTSQPSLS